jgi:ArsR family transcriptional regulator
MKLSEKLKLLSDENRLRIINLILKEELCNCEIETILELSQSNTSRHLSKMKGLEFWDSYKDGNWVHYRIKKDETYTELIEFLKQEFKKEEIFVKDLERLDKYKNSGMNCTVIREDKDKVLDYLKF